MGTLIAFRYPTNMLARLADHTYVACGTLGKAWGCWGGKTGGTELRRGSGSTKRADAIAEPDERAGITCYLINGVCHQAANRILLPAMITVQGARGYSVSSALYGTYGRPKGILGLCRAPFNRHAGVTGDLAECIDARDSGKSVGLQEAEPDPRERAFLERTLALYASSDTGDVKALVERDDVVRQQLALFEVFVDYKLGGDPQMKGFTASRERNELMQVREKTEYERLAVESRFQEDKDVDAFVSRYNELTLHFQAEVERTLDKAQYSALLDLEPGDHVVLADPEIVEHAYRGGREGGVTEP